ncbi:glycosyl hydrolase family 65 protein [Nocardia sp. CA-135398]|uniref:glycosyl hydrolase family 65 protein n=1 Tax=Nocardia sp. CA-135398 TaxID=3239977 RepID=UPI003D98AE4F
MSPIRRIGSVASVAAGRTSRDEFTLSYRGQPLTVTITHSRATVRLHPSAAAPIHLCVEDVERTLSSGQTWEVPLAAVPNRTGAQKGPS